MAMKRFLMTALLLLSLPALAAGLKAVPPRAAPELAIPLLDGKAVSMTKLRGQVVLVSFWATWCPPCRKEMPSMDRLTKMLARQPFALLAVNVGEPEDMVDRYFEQFPMSFMVGLDEDNSRSKAWKAFLYPTSYLVDKKGRIRYAVNGAVEWDAPEVVEIIDQLLRE